MHAHAHTPSPHHHHNTHTHTHTHTRPLRRLGLFSSIAERIQLLQYPYHFCALTADSSLALYLYAHGVPCNDELSIASFSASGAGGTTSWTKHLSLSPSDLAAMGGYGDLHRVLQNVEKGVPLEWSSSQHRKFNEEFK